MSQHVFLAFTNPAGEREEPFNSWYNQSHVPEVLRYGRGFKGCRRYRLEAGSRAGGLTPWRYLALYDLESDDLALLASQPFTDRTRLTPFRGLVEEDHVGWVYTAATPPIPANPAHRVPQSSFADCLVLAWQHAQSELLDPAGLRNSLAQTPGCLAARAYSKGTAQRSNQQDSPWQGLVIYEMERRGGAPTFDNAWTYIAVAEYVNREPS